jgi:hypothetical protein
MNRFADFAIQFFTRNGETILIARIVNALRAELERRKEYALRYGIHSSQRWRA